MAICRIAANAAARAIHGGTWKTPSCGVQRRRIPVTVQPLLLSAIALGVMACGPVTTIKTSSGDQIGHASFEERFPLSSEAHEVTFHGDDLRRAIALMDRHGVLALSGTYEASGVLDKSTLVLSVRTTDDRERKVVVKNCAEPHVCAFFTEAVTSGVVKKTPVICRDVVACTKK